MTSMRILIALKIKFKHIINNGVKLNAKFKRY